MLLLLLIIIFALAFLVGLIGNISGIGGGVMITLFLIYVFNFSPLDAAGLSLLTLVFSSLTGFVQNMRKKLVDTKLLLILATVAVIGAFMGSILASYVPSRVFKGLFTFILVTLGIFSVYSTRSQARKGTGDNPTAQADSTDTGIVSFLAGLVSGFIGIGIGGIVGTYLTAIKRINPKRAIATIIAATFPVTMAGMLLHFYYTDFINIVYAPPLVIGAFIGGMLGSWIIRKAPQMSLRFFQGYIIIAFGILSAILFLMSYL